MSTKNAEKTPYKFFCEQCNFKCSKKCDYNRHLITLKHKNQQNQQKNAEKTPKNIDMNRITCICGKSYKDRSGLWRHNKVCTQNVTRYNETKLIEISDENVDYKSMFLKSMEQNQELMNLLVSQNTEHNKIIKEMVPRIGNNNTTTNNTNHFNLNVFLNEDCKDAINFSEFIDNIQVSFADLEHQSEIGYVNGISKLFIENLRSLGTYKRPIHCTDKKRKTLYIKENNNWDKEGSQNTLKQGIQEVSRKGFECLSNEKKENTEEYQDIESDFSQKCLLIQRNLIPNAPRETTINKVIENISKNSGVVE